MTWSQGRVIFDPGQNDQTIGNQIVVPTTGPATGVLIDDMSWAAGGETRLSTSGSFAYLTAPQAGGLFLGDYDGLTSSGTTFKALFNMSQPIATTGRSDTFSNSAG